MKELETYYDPREGERHLHKWGYTDTRFEFDGPKSVRVTGDRYPISGFSMPYLIPFVESVLEVPFTEDHLIDEVVDYDLPAPVAGEEFLVRIRKDLSGDQVSQEPRDRLSHSHGQLSVDEIYRLMTGGKLDRVVDGVVYPNSEEDVRRIVEAGATCDVCLIPFGGGTNVSGALACPPDETRMIVSVDMRRMNRILWIDEINQLACIEAGISGKQMEIDLGAKGYTTGHDPDSIEFSTLGGWVSTNASGMKKNRYGNIEDIVLEASLVTPKGDVETRAVTPRNSIGVQPRSLLFGSEGNYGIITKAVMKVHPLPEAREYGALVFPDFEKGVDFLRTLRRTGTLPASIRLVNNLEFRMGQALKPATIGAEKLKSKIQHFALFKVKKFDLQKMVASTIVMEGSRAEVKAQQKTIFELAKKFGAISAGASNGKRGYSLTFGIAYIRDFVTRFGILGETFETSVPWDRIHDVCNGVREELDRQLAEHGVEGRPYLTYRVTQTYHTGVCIYFTLAFSGRGLDDPAAVYHRIEHALRQVILDRGGSLSHHHGVGKIRQGFLKQVQTDAGLQMLRETKRAIDPANIFGARNGAFDEDRTS
ncbi:MAG: oxidase [Gemmatimonadetes bacterium]|nr:oxidase [Gemmatimonadota bacterium]